MKHRKLLSSLLMSFAFNGVAAPVMPEREPTPPTHKAQRDDRYAAIVMDAKTGEILYAHDSSQKLHPASTTKVMTAYLTFRALKKGEITLDTKLNISLHAARQERTNLGLIEPKKCCTKSGRKHKKPAYVLAVRTITVKQALEAMLVHSANDAAMTLAENIGGSEEKFVTKMNAAAKEIGMANTKFTNPNGLPDKRQVTTVEDMAKLSRAVIRDFPEYYHFFGNETFSFKRTTYTNHNKLLGVYPGLDGLKTGWIATSGHNLTASAQRGGDRVIAVIFGARKNQINSDMKQLLDFGFEKMRDAQSQFTFDTRKTAQLPRPPSEPAEEYAIDISSSQKTERPNTDKPAL